MEIALPFSFHVLSLHGSFRFNLSPIADEIAGNHYSQNIKSKKRAFKTFNIKKIPFWDERFFSRVQIFV